MTRTAILLALAGLFGATAVALGAWAVHGLDGGAGGRASMLVETGVRYQLWHALAMIGTLALYRSFRRDDAPASAVWLAHAAQLFAMGVILFCGALYGLALGGPRWLGMIAPIGGLSLIAGWLALAWGAVNACRAPQSRG